MAKWCCPNCFSDPWLIEQVRDRSNKTGDCDFCGSVDLPVLFPEELEAEFSNAIYQLYSVVEYGENLGPGEDYIDVGSWPAELLQEDFDVFSEKLDRQEHTSLLAAIMADDESFMAKTFYTRRNGWPFDEPSSHCLWLEFCTRLRKDPMVTWEYDGITGWVVQRAYSVPAGSFFYRARAGYGIGQHGPRPWSGDEIGAPPKKKWKAGRLNRADQAILYCADTEPTAIAEMRPWRGAHLSMCCLKSVRDLTVIDLHTDVPWLNPFTENDLRQRLELGGILRAFTQQLSLPLTRNDDEANEYPPCQYLASRIRSKYDGISYRSAMSARGKNFAFFDPSALEVLPSWLLKMRDVQIPYEEISSSAFCMMNSQWPGPLFETTYSYSMPNAAGK